MITEEVKAGKIEEQDEIEEEDDDDDDEVESV